MKKLIFILFVFLSVAAICMAENVGTVVVTLESVDTIYDDSVPIAISVDIKMSNGPNGVDPVAIRIPYDPDVSGTVNQYCLAQKALFEQAIQAIPPHNITSQVVDISTLNLDPSIKKA